MSDFAFEVAKSAVRESLRVGEDEARLTVAEAALVELALANGYADVLADLLARANAAGVANGISEERHKLLGRTA